MSTPHDAEVQRLRLMKEQVQYIAEVQGHAEHIVYAILRARRKVTGRALWEEVAYEYGRTMTQLATV